MSWRTAIDLATELCRDTGSHLFASIAKYKYVASHGDLAAIVLANSIAGTKIPYPERDENYVEPAVREEVMAYYAEHSALN